MATAPPWTRRFVLALIVVGGLFPLAIYWVTAGRAPDISPEQARQRLSEPDSRAVLVDVRSAEAYAKNHIEAARHWPYEQIQRLSSAEQVPAEMKGRQLLLVCDSGWMSGLATRRLRELGVADVLNVRGGMQDWFAASAKPCSLSLCRLGGAGGTTQGLPFRESPAHEQWAAVLTGFGVKPFYMLSALLLVWLLRRSVSPDLVALRWGLLAFFIGEAFCAANYLMYGEASRLFEYLHSFGMVLSFGFATYAAFEALDLRLIHYSDPEKRCAAVGLCRGCIKHADVPCGLQRVFLLLIPATMVLAAMPFCADTHLVSYNTQIWGTPYNYSHPIVHQSYEIRFCPAVALILLAASFAALAFKRTAAVATSKVFFAAAMGPLGFCFLRLMLFAPYRDNLVWFAFWEEITELLFIAAAGAILWIFRRPGRPADHARDIDPAAEAASLGDPAVEPSALPNRR